MNESPSKPELSLRAGSRNAVETAIAIAKTDRHVTWEQAAAENMPEQLKPWETAADRQEGR